MNPLASRLRTLAGGALFLLLGALPALPQGQPDFAGRWRFDPQRSDDVRALVRESVGPDYTTGDVKKEGTRMELRSWLLAVAEKPETMLLTIEQTPQEFRYGFGDEVGIYYFAREGTRQAPNGEIDKTRVRWRGEQLVVEQEGDRGTRLTTAFTLQPGGRQILLTLHMENKALRKPLDLRLGFDRVDRKP